MVQSLSVEREAVDLSKMLAEGEVGDTAEMHAAAMQMDYDLGYLPPELCCDGTGCLYCTPDEPSEWDYRAPTLAEQVAHAQASWDGPRCPHGMAIMPFGPDIICGWCEDEASQY